MTGDRKNMIIHDSLIALNLQSKNKVEIIEALARKARKLGRIRNVKGYMQTVFAREAVFSTAIGYGIAIPHGKSSFVEVPFLAFARSQEEFLWDSRLEHKVRLIFLIGVPEEQDSDLHLRIAADIRRELMNNGSYRERLLQATSVAEVVAIFGEMRL